MLFDCDIWSHIFYASKLKFVYCGSWPAVDWNRRHLAIGPLLSEGLAPKRYVQAGLADCLRPDA